MNSVNPISAPAEVAVVSESLEASPTGSCDRWSLLLATFSLAFFIAGTATSASLGTFSAQSHTTHLSWLLFALIASLSVTVLAAVEWNVILSVQLDGRQIGLRRLVILAMETVCLQNSIHHFAGQAHLVRRLARHKGHCYAEGISLLAVDQLAEAAAKALFTFSLLLFAASEFAPTESLPWLVAGVVATYACLRAAIKYAGRLGEQRTPLFRRASLLLQSLDLAMSSGIMLQCVSLALAKKILRAASVYLVQRALAIDCPSLAPWLVILALEWATAVPLIPGHWGVYEAAIAAVYVALGLTREQGLLLGLSYHLVQLTASLAPGLIVLVLKSILSGSLCEGRVGRFIRHRL